LFGIASAGLAGCLRTGGSFLLLGALIGLLLMVLAVTFWKLDERTSFLVKHAESTLALLEADHLPDIARLFQTEPEKTSEQHTLKQNVRKPWSYSTCFRVVFVFAMLIGLPGAATATAMHLMSSSCSG